MHFSFHPQGRGQQRALAFFFLFFFLQYVTFFCISDYALQESLAISLACDTRVDLQLWRHGLYYNCFLLWHITYSKTLPISEGTDIAVMCLNCFMRTTRLLGRMGRCCWYIWCSAFGSTVGKKAHVSLLPWVPSLQTILPGRIRWCRRGSGGDGSLWQLRVLQGPALPSQNVLVQKLELSW